MRSPVDVSRLRQLLKSLGEASRGEGSIFITGGGTALLEGWRASTVDVDIKCDPEPEGVFEAISELKNRLDVNVELASPDLFIPAVPGWRKRSRFIARHGSVDFYHFDFISQALAKIERGHGRDLDDVREMLARGLVTVQGLRQGFAAIVPFLLRYPSVDPTVFEAKLGDFLAQCRSLPEEP